MRAETTFWVAFKPVSFAYVKFLTYPYQISGYCPYVSQEIQDSLEENPNIFQTQTETTASTNRLVFANGMRNFGTVMF